MARVYLGIILLIGMWSGTGWATMASPVVHRVTPLHELESFRNALLYHNQLLWVGKSPERLLEAFDDSFKKVASASVPHAILAMTAYGNGVIAVGFSDGIPQYSFVTRKGPLLHVTTRTMARAMFPLVSVASHGGELLFAAPSGKPGYEQALGETLHPIETLVGVNSAGRARWLDYKFPAPEQVVALGSFVFVLQGNKLGYGDENLVRIDWASGRAQSLFRNPQTITDLKTTRDGKLVITDSAGKQIHVVNPEPFSVEHSVSTTIELPGRVEAFGRCLAVASLTQPHIEIIARSSETRFRWDLTSADPRFFRVGAMASNSRGVFIRSTLPGRGKGVVLFADQENVREHCLGSQSEITP